MVKDLLREEGRKLNLFGRSKTQGPLPANYKPELDVTKECDAEMVSQYQQLIGILHWAVELGRIDIQLEIAIMSQYQANQRCGHLEALHLIFWYLFKRPLKRLVMDPTDVRMPEDAFYNMADSDN